MDINLFGYRFSFGRPKKTPVRETIQQAISNLPTEMQRKQTMRKPNAAAVRQFARNSIPRRAIHIIKDGILKLPSRFVPVDPADETDYSEVINMLKFIINNPNDVDNYKEFWGALIEDTLTGDCGAAEIVKVANLTRPLYLFPVDGFTIEYVKGFDSSTPEFPRYAQKNSQNKLTYFMNEDILMIKKNNFSYDMHGLSPIESAFMYIDFLLNTQYYANSVTSKGIPKFILNLGETLNETQILAFRKYFTEEIMGSGDIPIVGGSKGISSCQIGAINDDGLYLDYQSLLITIIAFTFGVDPKKLGQGSATDRSTVAEQNESCLNEAIKPYAEVIADAINAKILGRLGFKGILKFEFIYEETLEQKKTKADIVHIMWLDDALTQNEMRKMYGLPKSDSKYADYTYSELKAKVNADNVVQTGGFNGVGTDRHIDTPSKGGDTKNE